MDCKNCGSQLLSGAKFCGKCGEKVIPDSDRRQSFKERVDKHATLKNLTASASTPAQTHKKKSSNADEGVMLLGFLLSLGSSLNDNFGFVPMVDAQSFGMNVVPFAGIALFVISAIRIMKKGKKNDIENISESKNKGKYFRGAFLKVAIMVSVLLCFGIYHYVHQKQAIATVLQDALYGTKQSDNPELTKAMADIFTYYKEEGARRYSNTLAVDTVGLLEINSYKSKQSLLNVINTLKASVDELANFDEIQSQIKEGAREKIRNSNLPENEKVEVLKGFNSSVSDIQQALLSKKRNTSLMDTYNLSLRLYEFLYENFSDYKISTDDAGNQNIAFYTDNNIAIYNQYIQEIKSANSVFILADKEWRDYGNSSLGKVGVTVDEITNSAQ